MKIKDIDLVNISRFRGEHMGLAMLFVVLFHVWLPRNDDFYGLRRVGNLGVDIFLFLSGVGLWFSWTKSLCIVEGQKAKGFFQRWFDFYLRRLIRIYPAWLVMSSCYYIPPFLKHAHHTTAGWIDLFGDILINWDFWLHDELTFWYIPATMMLYIFAPPYMELIRRHPVYQWLVVVMIMWCVLVQYVTPIHSAVGHIEIFWSRVPIFFLGINIGEAVKQKRTLDGQSIWMIWIMFIMTLGTSVWLEQMLHGKFPLFLERLLYIPLTITTVLLFNRVFRRTPSWFNKCFSIVGVLSLEAYLIHLHFVLVPLEHYRLGYWLTFILTIAITIPMAYVLHFLIDKLTKLLYK